jgi:hypothetical protein
MTAHKGNQYYLLRKRHGRKLCLTPDGLRIRALEYFFDRNMPRCKNGSPVGLVYSLSGILRYIGISYNTFHRYEKRKEFKSLCTELIKIINTHAKMKDIQKKLNPKIYG